MLTKTTPNSTKSFNAQIMGRTSLDRTLATNEPMTGYGLTRPGSILQIATGVVRGFDGGAKALAIATGKPVKVLNNELCGSERHKLGLIDTINHSMIANDYSVCMEWARLGGFAIIKPPCLGLVDDIELMTSYSRFMKEVGDVAQQLNDTLADRKVTLAEAQAMVKEAHEVVSALFAFIARINSLVED